MKPFVVYCLIITLLVIIHCNDFLSTGNFIPDPPNSVTLLETSEIYPTAVSMSWLRTTSKNFANYKFFYDTVPEVTDSSILALTIINKSDTSIFLTGLQDNTTYYATVYTYNNTSSRKSNIVSFTTKPCKCGVFTGEKKDGMVLIPAGCFFGKDTSTVTISNDFYMDSIEVTVAEWDKIVGGDSLTSRKPQAEISWFQMILFCNKKSNLFKKDTCYTYSKIIIDTNMNRIKDLFDLECDFMKNGFRLPTEDEWEYAYRAGSIKEYCWGKDGNTKMEYPYENTYPITHADTQEISEYAWWSSNNFPDETKEVALLKPNRWHLYDMAGNVQEFVWDISIDLRSKSRIDYRGPEKTPQGRTGRNVRGGKYDYTSRYLTAWWRNSWVEPDYNFKKGVGFRTVCTAIP